MSPSRSARLRRLLADLSSGGTRPKAVARVRRKAGARVAGGAVDRRPAPKVVAPPPLPLTAGRRPTWYVGAWGRLASAVAGKDPALDPGTPHPDDGAALVRSARRHRGQAAFAEALGAGLPLSVATCRAVSMLAAVREHSAAWALAESVHRMPGGADAGTAGHAVLLHSRGQLLRAWERVRPLDDAILLEALPLQAVDAALAAGTEESRARAVRLVADPTVFGAADLVDLAGRFLVMGHRPEALALVAELTGRSEVALDERRAHVADRLEEWLSDREVLVPDGAVPIGIIDYSSPDHVLTSGNLGDYVQTLALLGNLARLGDLTFTGEHGLGEVATELQGHVQARFRVPGVDGAVHLVPVDRDVSSLGSVPADTWAVAFGWHMHPLFGLKYDFPYNPHLRPIFVSFHVNRLDMLDDEALAYLREHGPVGCRDWTTVNLLLSAGVDAFFTGCFTSTVDTLFPERSEVFSGSRGRGLHRPQGRAGQGGAAAAAPVREYTRPVRRVPLHGTRGGDPGRPRPTGGVPARPRSRRDQPVARLPAAHLARGPGRLPTGQPGRRPLRRPRRAHAG